MKILITGANGMLGSSLCPVLKKKGYEILPTDINLDEKVNEFLDVRDFNELKNTVEKFKPNIIMHLAAETDLEKCEKNEKYAYLTNTIGTHNAALICKENDLPLVYISTAGVFDGEKEGLYTEFDKPNPINVYGKTKYEGEKIVEKTLHKYFIARAGWMIGGGKKDKKFIMKIIKQLDEEKKELNVVYDKYGTPTYTEDFSNCLSNLILTKFYGTYHMVCEGGGSRYDVTVELLNFLGRNDVKLNKVSSDFFKAEYFAQRPKSEMLENFVLKLRNLNTMRNWKDALHDYLNTHFKDRKYIKNE